MKRIKGGGAGNIRKVKTIRQCISHAQPCSKTWLQALFQKNHDAMQSESYIKAALCRDKLQRASRQNARAFYYRYYYYPKEYFTVRILLKGAS